MQHALPLPYTSFAPALHQLYTRFTPALHQALTVKRALKRSDNCRTGQGQLAGLQQGRCVQQLTVKRARMKERQQQDTAYGEEGADEGATTAGHSLR